MLRQGACKSQAFKGRKNIFVCAQLVILRYHELLLRYFVANVTLCTVSLLITEESRERIVVGFESRAVNVQTSLWAMTESVSRSTIHMLGEKRALKHPCNVPLDSCVPN